MAQKNNYRQTFLIIILLLIAGPAGAKELSTQIIHQYSKIDPFSFILLEFCAVVTLAVIGHIISKQYRIPTLVGALVIGIVIGNILFWLDLSPFIYMLMHLADAGEIFKTIWTSDLSVAETIIRYYVNDNPESSEFANRLSQIFTSSQSPALILLGVALWIISNIGVFLISFKLGLEIKIQEIVKSAEPLAYLISIAGTLATFFLGLSVVNWLLPDMDIAKQIFIAAALCTTSAAITTSIFTNVSREQSREAKLVINAAFIDDILGIFFLSYIANIVLGDTRTISQMISLLLYSLIVILAIFFLGRWVTRYIPKIYNFDEPHSRLLVPVMMVVFVSFLTNLFDIGIVSSAFIAGLILNGVHDKVGLIKDIIGSLEKLFAPIFFVFVGMQVNLRQFLDGETILLTIALLMATIAGKIAAGYISRQRFNNLAVGLGMVPRGEAVLISISIGKILGLVDDSIFSVIAIIVLITDFIAPWAIDNLSAKYEASDFFIKRY